MKKRRLYAVINIVALCLLALVVGIDYFNEGIVYMMVNDAQGFQEVFQSKSIWFQAFAIIGLIIIEVIIGIIPGHLIYPIIGVLVHPFFGGVLIVIGNIIGSIANYYQGKILSSGLSKKEVNEKKSFVRKLKDGGAWTLFLLKLNPLTSLDLLSYFAGAVRMKFWPFLAANTFGLMPMIFVQTYAADALFTKYSWIWQVLVVVTIAWIVYELVKLKRK
jgi:uncharacterized membrane protein YdjX (TVP38/TMEM64 family)